MKTYNLNPSVVNVAGNDISVLKLGEKGRGRVEKLIKCDSITDSMKVLAPKAGMPGNVKIVADVDNSVGLIIRVSTEGSYVRGANGNVSVSPNDVDKVNVVAKGYGAFGDAGRTGTWDDVLLVVTNATVLRVKPSRGDAYLMSIDEDFNVQKLSYSEAELLEIDLHDSTDSARGEFVKL